MIDKFIPNSKKAACSSRGSIGANDHTPEITQTSEIQWGNAIDNPLANSSKNPLGK